MKIEIGEIVTLDDNKEFICMSRNKYKDSDYLFLLSNFKPVEVMFAKEIVTENGVDLKEVNNQQEKIDLMKVFKDYMLNQN